MKPMTKHHDRREKTLCTWSRFRSLLTQNMKLLHPDIYHVNFILCRIRNCWNELIRGGCHLSVMSYLMPFPAMAKLFCCGADRLTKALSMTAITHMKCTALSHSWRMMEKWSSLIVWKVYQRNIQKAVNSATCIATDSLQSVIHISAKWPGLPDPGTQNKNSYTGPGKKMVPRLQEFFRQDQARSGKQ